MSGIVLFLFTVLCRAELCTDFEQVVLNLSEQCIEIGVRHWYARPTDAHCSARRPRRTPRRGARPWTPSGATEESGFACITRLRVDFHASVPPLEKQSPTATPRPLAKARASTRFRPLS